MKNTYLLYVAALALVLMGLVTGNEGQIAGGIIWTVLIGILHGIVVAVRKFTNKEDK